MRDRLAAETKAATSPGMTFDTTDTTPVPPSDMMGSVKASSPDMTAHCGVSARSFVTRSGLPEASLMAATFGQALTILATVSTSRETQVLPGIS